MISELPESAANCRYKASAMNNKPSNEKTSLPPEAASTIR
jgi:hypothetical protein